MGGWSNLILLPTLAFIRAQLGFRIQVQAECGNDPDYADKELFLDLKTSEILQFLDPEIMQMSEQAWLGSVQFELDVQYPRLASSADS